MFRVGQRIRTEPWPGIRYCNYDSAEGIRLQPAPDLFGPVIVASVDHGIDQGFLHGQTDLQSLLLRNLQLNQGPGYRISDIADRICVGGETDVEQFG